MSYMGGSAAAAPYKVNITGYCKNLLNVQAFEGYPQWSLGSSPRSDPSNNIQSSRYYNIQKYAPQDCVKTIENIVDKYVVFLSLIISELNQFRIDQVIATNNTAATTELKKVFGLETLQDIRDFALTVAV